MPSLRKENGRGANVRKYIDITDIEIPSDENDYDELVAFADAIAEQEIIQLPECKKGKWIATYSDCGGDVWVSWKCSNCGYVRKKGWKYNGGEKPDALFCEMCNADMRGEQDG